MNVNMGEIPKTHNGLKANIESGQWSLPAEILNVLHYAGDTIEHAAISLLLSLKNKCVDGVELGNYKSGVCSRRNNNLSLECLLFCAQNDICDTFISDDHDDDIIIVVVITFIMIIITIVVFVTVIIIIIAIFIAIIMSSS